MTQKKRIGNINGHDRIEDYMRAILALKINKIVLLRCVDFKGKPNIHI